ncbi:MAG: cupredoxin domain-containing protein [Chloroflexi bacterium]|nr:cupredoxin domain-containing protein [Chloroflexota bacterium]
MAEERQRRRRGRRRGGGGGHPSDRPTEQRPEEGQTEERPEEAEPQSVEESSPPSRRRFFFGRRRGHEGEAGEKAERGHGEREERQAAGTPAHISPLSFWRRGRSRTYREQPVPKQTMGRTLRRLRGMYLPPWVPVMFIVVVVFGILGVLFVVRGVTGAPRNGDHWHATYQTFICGQRQPHFPIWEASQGIHTHADGIIHMHPFTPSGEGAGARLVKWFEYGGGKLTQSELRKPGSREEFKNGDLCDDGREGFVQVFVTTPDIGVEEKLEDWSRYIPQDGDRVRIVFGPEAEAGLVEQEDRTVIPESEAARTVEIEVTGAEGDAAFVPDSIELGPGETVKLLVRNTGSISHSVRVEGADGLYETSDDFVSEPEIIQPGEEGYLIVRLDEVGEVEFKDPTAPGAIGTLVVTDEPTGEVTDAPEEVDVTFDVSMGDNFFEPSELEVEAGQTFRINLTNAGEFIHNLRIAGADGEFETGDDLVSTPKFQTGGESGELVGQIDKPGVYSFRSDSQSTEMTGTITVK